MNTITQSNPKHRHHYIPVFYLKGFTNKGSWLYVYDKEDKPIRESSPEGVAYENNYFTFITPDGEKDSETVENGMSELENRFAVVLKKINNCESLAEDERITFAFFVASMMVRAPNMRNNIKNATEKTMEHMNIFMSSHK